ncbi:MAG TPA: hypothetical protein VIM64_21910 [Puia sp.]
MLKTSLKLLLIILFFSHCTSFSKKSSSYQIGSTGDSILTNYFDNGQKSDETIIKNGVPNGMHISFFANGNIKDAGLLVNGLKTSVWKFYDSSSNHLIRVQHFSEDTAIYDLSVDDFDLVEKSNDAAGFSIRLPFTWVKKLSDSAILLTSHKDCDSAAFCPNITITKGSMDAHSLADFIDTAKNALMNRFQDCHFVSERHILVNNKPSFQTAFTFLEENHNLAGLITIIQNGPNVYNIVSMADNNPPGSFLKYKGLFEEIANTFRVR